MMSRAEFGRGQDATVLYRSIADVHLDFTRTPQSAMNAVDGSDHYSKTSDEPPPSLLTIILDTNPFAWDDLEETLPITTAIANIQVFINAHIAINNANKVAVIASHCQRAEFLYPQPPTGSLPPPSSNNPDNGSDSDNNESDIEMEDVLPPSDSDANQYRPFRFIQSTLLDSLETLLAATTPESLTPHTALAGALTLALTYINKQQVNLNATSASTGGPSSSSAAADDSAPPPLVARILIISVSGDLALQYIPIMNTIFACQHNAIPIDILKLAGSDAFLQQAPEATGGIYVRAQHPGGLLQYLMMAFLPDQTARKSIVSPTQVGVDFRAACFCHRREVDVGFVCSVCLSIFCEVPEGAVCLTCGTHLSLGNYGAKPVLVKKKKKKKKQQQQLAAEGEVEKG